MKSASAICHIQLKYGRWRLKTIMPLKVPFACQIPEVQSAFANCGVTSLPAPARDFAMRLWNWRASSATRNRPFLRAADEAGVNNSKSAHHPRQTRSGLIEVEKKLLSRQFMNTCLESDQDCGK
jgi:hypothetical protein